jgi:hypothetical protein
MTGFALPPLVVAYDTRWVNVDLGGDLGEWASQTAREMLARSSGGGSGRPGRPGRPGWISRPDRPARPPRLGWPDRPGRPARPGRPSKSLAALLESAGAIARRAGGASMALLLYPSHRDGVKAVVRFCPVDLGGREGEEAWAALLADPCDRALSGVLNGEPPEVVQIATGAGPCRRIRQRHATDRDGEPMVGERLGYAWIFPRHRAGMLMTTGFTDLLEAGRWRPVVDDLAVAAVLAPAPAAGKARPGW